MKTMIRAMNQQVAVQRNAEIVGTPCLLQPEEKANSSPAVSHVPSAVLAEINSRTLTLRFSAHASKLKSLYDSVVKFVHTICLMKDAVSNVVTNACQSPTLLTILRGDHKCLPTPNTAHNSQMITQKEFLQRSSKDSSSSC